MLRHYFTDDDDEKHEVHLLVYKFRDMEYSFFTHSGMFSKDHVDHATDILLNAIPALPENSSLLDLGCGYGVIGIVLAKAYGLRVTQSDVTFSAVEMTRRNCQRNKVKTAIIKSDCFENISGTFDAIAVNPPIHAGKGVTYRMYEDSREFLKSGGSLYVVTFKKHGAESTIAKLREVFGNCEILYKKKGIYVLRCAKEAGSACPAEGSSDSEDARS